jgi:transglutaminase-like putative cysteine protease
MVLIDERAVVGGSSMPVALDPPALVASHQLEQTIRYTYSEPVTDLHQRLIVVPPAEHGAQRRIEWSLEVRGVEEHRIRTRCDRWSNLVIDVRVPRVEAEVSFVVDARTALVDTALAPVRSTGRYLSPTPLTAAGDAIIELARHLDGRSPEQISAAVHGAMRYEFGVTDIWTTASEALELGRGVCQDYSHLMLAICRALGVQARYVSGHLAGEGGSHAWVEVLVPRGDGTTVVEAWDPTHHRQADERYLTIATGRDYTDVAPLSGSFENDEATSTLTVSKRLKDLYRG